jgi:phage terminase small subunit
MAGHRTLRLDTTNGLPRSPSKLYFYSRLPTAQRKFVDELIVCQNAAEAARRAGYENDRSAYRNLLSSSEVRCAIRERMETVTDLASVSAADVRRELRLIQNADATELAGIWNVPCRHCYGHNGQYQYTSPELYYIEQAYSYGEQGWPFACVTDEFGYTVTRHASAAYIAGKEHRSLDIKGGDGYTRTKPINQDCPQCHGQGEPMAYVCDTRKLSEGGKKLFKGLKINGKNIEVLTVNRQSVMDILARDTQVGIERKEISITLPRSAEEFDKAIQGMSQSDLEQLVGNMVTEIEGDFHVMEEPQQLNQPTKLTKPNRFTRGN